MVRLTSRLETRILLVLLGVASSLTAFAALTGEILEGDTAAIDRRVLLAFRVVGHLDTPVGPRWLQETARDITALGGFTVLSLFSIAAIVVLIAYRRKWEATCFGTGLLIAQTIAEAVKHFASRARPELVSHLDLVYSSSFPSGHALMSPVVYLTLAAVIAAGQQRRIGKITIISAAAALVAAIGVSRVYLGVHWPTDVLGGWILGCMISLCTSLAMAGRPTGNAQRPAPRRT